MSHTNLTAGKTLPEVDYAYPQTPEKWNGLVLTGEAPGKEEVKQGQPFVGRSGQLLNEMLEQAGIDRARCLVANVFRFQPPGNKVDHFFTSRRAAQQQNQVIAETFGPLGSVWCKNEYASEINHLEKVLQAWQPRMIIALGRVPFWALCGGQNITQNAGTIADCRLVPGMKVIPTFHPSYILRGNWSKRPEWLKHFLAAAHYVAEK